MFRPLRMKYLRLLVLTEDLPQISLTLAELGRFHPDPRPMESATRDDELTLVSPCERYREHYQQARSRLDKIGKLIPLPPPRLESVSVVRLPELIDTNAWLGRAWEDCSACEEARHRLAEEERLIREQELALQNFANLNIDLSQLRSTTRFLDFYVGSVPQKNLHQLQGSVQLAQHLLYSFLETGPNVHVVIVGPHGENESPIKSVLDAAGFQTLPIPPELASEPARVRADLGQRRQRLQQQRREMELKLETTAARLREGLLRAQYSLMLAEPFVGLDPAIRSSGHLALVAGWVPAAEVSVIEQQLRQALRSPFLIESRDPRPEERPWVPTVAPSNPLLASFSTLVRQYGIPRYGEIDPTPVLAVSFVLMFGMMFGDLGQGALILLASGFARRRFPALGVIGMSCGLSSMAFGLSFGSVFGYEHLIPALWLSPLADPIYMLKLALVWGVIFLVIACLLSIYNRVATGHLMGALFEHHGLVNLIFYLALVMGAYGVFQGEGFGILPSLLVGLSLSGLAAFRWREIQAQVGEKLLVVLIETLETIIGSISNTLSFLRVAAFSLNHVALSIAVFTLADMMGDTGHWITVVLGNLFILVLEGGIVVIQVMRLEYYEGFSRYFFGDGHDFDPLRLRASGSRHVQT